MPSTYDLTMGAAWSVDYTSSHVGFARSGLSVQHAKVMDATLQLSIYSSVDDIRSSQDKLYLIC